MTWSPTRSALLGCTGLGRPAALPLLGVLTMLFPLLAGCGGGAAPDPKKPHHTADGFRNNHPHEHHGFGGVLRWRWDRLRGHFPDGGPPHPEGASFPLAATDGAFLRRNNPRPSLTWIGHATLLLQVNGVNILTDPHFGRNAGPFSWLGPDRVVPPALSLADLPPIHAVVISHNHYDHLDRGTVVALNNLPGGPPRFFVPLGLKRWFAEQGIANVSEHDWWEDAAYRGLSFRAVPVQHFSSRTPFDRDKTLWAGWVVEAEGFRFLFGGDTGYSPDFREIRRRLGPVDLAALPIGAYAPRWFMGAMHITPEEAVQVHQDLEARFTVAMHWGTFSLTDEPLDGPPRRLAAARAAAGISPERFFVMQHGETRLRDPGTGTWRVRAPGGP